jgi:hypothetical protein
MASGAAKLAMTPLLQLEYGIEPGNTPLCHRLECLALSFPLQMLLGL